MKKILKCFSLICIIILGATCFVACENKQTYTLTFETYGSGEFPSGKYEIGSPVTYLPNTYKYGYNFLGWATDETYSTMVEVGDVVNKSLTLYAKYVLNEDHFLGENRKFNYSGDEINQEIEFSQKETFYLLIRDSSGNSNFSQIKVSIPEGSDAVVSGVRLRTSKGKLIQDSTDDLSTWTPKNQLNNTGYYVLEIDISAIGRINLKIS